MVFLFRGTYEGVDATFKVKSTSLGGLAFSGYELPRVGDPLPGSAASRSWTAGTPCCSATATGGSRLGDRRRQGRGSDAFAVTIWNKNNELYKSLPATPLSGGNITIHNPKSK